MENNQLTQEISGQLTLITDTDQLVASIVKALRQQTDDSSIASNDPYLNVKDAAKYLGCEPRRLYDLRLDNRIRFVKDGRRLLTRKSWIDKYLEEWS